MKIVIIGAGAMGCLFGAYLSRQNEVVMLDSYRPQVEAINQNGVKLTAVDGSEHHFPNVKACMSGEYHDKADLVIVLVKSTFTEAALEANRDLFGENTIAMTLQNGAGNDRKIAKFTKPENVIIGTTRHNAVNMGMGAVRHGGAGVTTIGSNFEAGERLQIVAKLFGDCGVEIEVSDDIQRIIWSKLFVNLSINTFTAITETPIGFMIEDKNAWNFAKRLIYEAVDVAEEDGTYFDRRQVLENVRKVCEQAKNGFSSMYQDRKRGAKTEIDAINGAIVEQAKLYGVPVPYNTLIVDLIHAIEGADEFKRTRGME